jgi:hypothetical protein
MDVRFVARFAGRGGCTRKFLANGDEIVDVTAGRYGYVGRGFRDLFALRIRNNCDASDAWELVILDALERGVVPEQIEKRELVGPLGWEEFKQVRAEVAHRAEKVGTSLPDKRTFYYVRIGRRQGKAVTGEGWVSEALVMTDDCAVVKLSEVR